MPVLEKTTGGEVYLRGIDRRVSIGDRVDVNEEFAAYLTEERTDFRPVDDHQDAEFREVDEDEQDDEEGFDAEAFVDRTPMDAVVEDIEAGDVDDYLDDVQAAEEDGRDRVGVHDAIGQRRAELEE